MDAAAIAKAKQDAVYQAMMDDLGMDRLDHLPMNDKGPRRNGGPAPLLPRVQPTVSRAERRCATSLAEKFKRALADGDFDDDDAEAVKGLDTLASGRLHALKRGEPLPGMKRAEAMAIVRPFFKKGGPLHPENFKGSPKNSLGSGKGRSRPKQQVELPPNWKPSAAPSRKSVAYLNRETGNTPIHVHGFQAAAQKPLGSLNTMTASTSAPKSVPAPVPKPATKPGSPHPTPFTVAVQSMQSAQLPPTGADPEPAVYIFKCKVYVQQGQRRFGDGFVFLSEEGAPVFGLFQVHVNGCRIFRYVAPDFGNCIPMGKEIWARFQGGYGTDTVSLIFSSTDDMKNFATSWKRLQNLVAKQPIQTVQPVPPSANTNAATPMASDTIRAQPPPEKSAHTPEFLASAQASPTNEISSLPQKSVEHIDRQGHITSLVGLDREAAKETQVQTLGKTTEDGSNNMDPTAENDGQSLEQLSTRILEFAQSPAKAQMVRRAMLELWKELGGSDLSLEQVDAGFHAMEATIQGSHPMAFVSTTVEDIKAGRHPDKTVPATITEDPATSKVAIKKEYGPIYTAKELKDVRPGAVPLPAKLLELDFDLPMKTKAVINIRNPPKASTSTTSNYRASRAISSRPVEPTSKPSFSQLTDSQPAKPMVVLPATMIHPHLPEAANSTDTIRKADTLQPLLSTASKSSHEPSDKSEVADFNPWDSFGWDTSSVVTGQGTPSILSPMVDKSRPNQAPMASPAMRMASKTQLQIDTKKVASAPLVVSHLGLSSSRWAPPTSPKIGVNTHQFAGHAKDLAGLDFSAPRHSSGSVSTVTDLANQLSKIKLSQHGGQE